MKYGLVRVVDAEGHAGTLAQGRWGLLCAAQGAEVVAERLRSLVRDTEREEAARGVPSLQLWTGLVKILQVDGVSGSSLLVAPSCAPGGIRRWGHADGWGLLPQPGDHMLHTTLTPLPIRPLTRLTYCLRIPLRGPGCASSALLQLQPHCWQWSVWR